MTYQSLAQQWQPEHRSVIAVVVIIIITIIIIVVVIIRVIFILVSWTQKKSWGSHEKSLGGG